MTEAVESLAEAAKDLKIDVDASTAKPKGKRSDEKNGAGRGKGKGGPRGNDTPAMQLSKALSYILRHGTAKEGLKVRSDGFVALHAVLARPKVANIKMEGGTAPSKEDVQAIVQSNDKKRFELRDEVDEQGCLIRAVQGHSIVEVTKLDHVKLTLDNLHLLADQSKTATTEATGQLPDGVEILHGTTRDAWTKILASGGLSRMKRNHIHLAKGRPGSSSVISGMRASSPVIIHVDIIRGIRDGVSFHLASNGAVLTGGTEDTGLLPLAYLTKAEESKTGKTLWEREGSASSAQGDAGRATGASGFAAGEAKNNQIGLS